MMRAALRGKSPPAASSPPRSAQGRGLAGGGGLARRHLPHDGGRGVLNHADASSSCCSSLHCCSRERPRRRVYEFPHYDDAAQVRADCDRLLADLKQRERAIAALPERGGGAGRARSRSTSASKT